MDRPETIEETAELVTAAGGTGIPVQADHLDSAQVEALAGRIDREQGRLDVLVNDIWGADALWNWNTPVWEQDLGKGLRLLELGVHTHLITSHHTLPLLIRNPGGLVVEVTDGTWDFNAPRYRENVYYDLAKTAVNRLAFAQAHELRPHGGTAVALTPGFLRSEAMLEHFGVTRQDALVRPLGLQRRPGQGVRVHRRRRQPPRRLALPRRHRGRQGDGPGGLPVERGRAGGGAGDHLPQLGGLQHLRLRAEPQHLRVRDLDRLHGEPDRAVGPERGLRVRQRRRVGDVPQHPPPRLGEPERDRGAQQRPPERLRLLVPERRQVE